jgi:hypothetical protein
MGRSRRIRPRQVQGDKLIVRGHQIRICIDDVE